MTSQIKKKGTLDWYSKFFLKVLSVLHMLPDDKWKWTLNACTESRAHPIKPHSGLYYFLKTLPGYSEKAESVNIYLQLCDWREWKGQRRKCAKTMNSIKVHLIWKCNLQKVDYTNRENSAARQLKIKACLVYLTHITRVGMSTEWSINVQSRYEAPLCSCSLTFH